MKISKLLGSIFFILFFSFYLKGQPSCPVASNIVELSPLKYQFSTPGYSCPAGATNCNWLWEFGDLGTGMGDIAIHTYAAQGIYGISVQVTYNDSLGNPVSCPKLLDTIYAFCYVNFSQNLTICNGKSITIGNSFYTTAGTYTDTLTAFNGCDSIVTTTLTVNPLPVANAGNDTAIKLGDTISLNATGGDNCSWSPTNNLSDPNSCNTIAAPTEHTTYTVTVIDSNSCSDVDRITIIIDSCLYYPYPTGNLNGTSGWITRVTINGGSASLIYNNSFFYSPSPAYSFSSATTTLYAGSTYSLCGAGYGSNPHAVVAWFDWNQDGDYADSGEFFDFGGKNIYAFDKVCVNVLVPSGAAIGKVGMRIRYAYDTDIDSSHHTNSPGVYGETIDYCLTVAAACVDCANGNQDCDETRIDCGGPCSPCPGNCYDGIQNQTETGVDCGGPCISCTPPAGSVGSGSCPGTANSVVRKITCAQIGTSAFHLSGGEVTFTSAGAALPTPAPSCGVGWGNGVWARYNLDADVISVSFSLDRTGSLYFPPGNYWIYGAFYQGTCGSLTQIMCREIVWVSTNQYIIQNIVLNNLNPNQDLYVYLFANDSSKSFSTTWDIIGAAAQSQNDYCYSARPASSGCNLVANADAWGGPMNQGATACDGGNWYSNENTVWYAVVADSASGSIQINDVICNDGESGNAQFGVFTSCACPMIPNYGTNSCFRGCAVGTGTLLLYGLAPGATYYLAVDGFGGDICKWDIVTSGMAPPVPVTYHNLTFCNGDSFLVGANTYYVSGIYNDTLNAWNGDDSIVITNLTVQNIAPDTHALSICNGQSVTVGNNTYNIAGTYVDTLTTTRGCDSVVTTILTVLPNNTVYQNPTICDGQSVTVGSSIYTIGGTYTDTLAASNGCDSMVTTMLTVNPLPAVNAGNDTTIRLGGVAELNASGGDSCIWTPTINIADPNSCMTTASPTQTTTYTVTVTDVNGCTDTASITIAVDSVNNVPSIINPRPEITLSANPFSTTTTITISSSMLREKSQPNGQAANLHFALYDILGSQQNTLVTINTTDNKTEIKIDRGNLYSGIYFYKITYRQQPIANGKLVVQ